MPIGIQQKSTDANNDRRVTVVLRLKIPLVLYKLIVCIVLLYRRLRYGYAFRRIPLTQGRFAIVDPHHYPQLAKYKWRISPGKNTTYAERSIRLPSGKYSRLLMHRQILSPPKGFVIDHINRNGLDNRSANLRLATVAQNAQNARKRKNRSGYKGVWLAKLVNGKPKWRAAIWHNNKRIYLGYFDSPKQAAKAYDTAAKKHHAQFANPNLK